MRNNINDLPSDLPAPLDDGATNHLVGREMPDLLLESTNQDKINMKDDFKKTSVLFIYPRAGSPLEPNLNPELWDATPGARGCTPQSCSFRDLFAAFKEEGVAVYGLSIQTPDIQREFVERNHINFPIISDKEYKFTDELKLPTFDFEGERLIKRMCFFIEDSRIEKVFYPVFPPDKNADEVLTWIKQKGSTKANQLP